MHQNNFDVSSQDLAVKITIKQLFEAVNSLSIDSAESIKPDFHSRLSPIADAIFRQRKIYLGRKINVASEKSVA